MIENVTAREMRRAAGKRGEETQCGRYVVWCTHLKGKRDDEVHAGAYNVV